MSTATADAEAAATRVNEEQVIHELEHKYVLLKADFAVLESEREEIVKQKNATTEQMKKLQMTVDEREAELVKSKEELLALRTERDQLRFQNRVATSQAERRLNDVEELQQTVKEQNAQLMATQRKEVQALQKVAEQEAIVEPLRHSTARLQAELEATKQHLEWAEKQLTDKTKLVQEMRQSSTKIAHDQEELKTRHADELTSVRKQLESARQVSKKLESSLVQANEQMKEVQAARMHEEERLHNELSAQRRLADLYKDSAEDATTRITELQELSETLRQSLAESEDALAHQEERTKQHVEHIFRDQAAESERRIQALQGELKETQERLDELQKNKILSLQTASTVSGVSSAAGVAHLAANGVTPKELCDQILALETALRSERDEKDQLQISLNRVVDEVREKAPMIMGLKQDLQQAIASNVKQSDQLQVCMLELGKRRARDLELVQAKQSYERKCDALGKSVDDLSRQVQHLLFRAHESSVTQNSGSGATGGDGTSENLVLFKDVEELQLRNQQLLMVIRDLTEAQKHPSTSANLIASGDSDEESDGEIGLSSSPGKRFKAALDEIEKMRSEREEERQMISAIVKQRDMYRVLLAQADSKFCETADRPGTPSASEPSNASQHHRRSSVDLIDSRAFRELQKEFEIYKKEKQTSMKTLQEELDRARSESSAFRLSQMQAQVEAKCNKDRYEAAEKRRQDAEEEVLRVRASADRINNLLVQHQKMSSETDAKFDAAVTKLRALEVEKDGALRELAFMKNNETKVLQELATMRLDNTNLLKLLDTNRQIDSSREERERRDSDRMAQKITVLENKLQEAYDKLESNDAVAGAKIAAEEQAKKIATSELAEAKEQFAATREQVARLEEQLAAVTTQSSLHEKEATHLRDQLRKGASTAAAERVATLEVQLRQSQLETQSAVEMKQSLMEAVSKYKIIAEANEKSLSELSAASESWKIEHEKKLATIQGERDKVRAELEKARSQINDDVSEGNKLREEMDTMVMSHQAALQLSQERRQQLQIEADAARTELSALQQEVSSLRDDVSTAQENYERELKLHASQVEKYSSTRKQVQEEQNKNRTLLGEVGELKARVMIAEKKAAESVSSMEKLLMDANHSKSSLAEQNKLLHAQLERANNELRRAHEAQLLQSVGGATTSAQAGAHDDREHTKELDDLRSVITYLRKENEISSSKFELAHQENDRYRAQVQGLESTIERLREELKRTENSGVDATARSVDTATKSAAQLEQLDLLRESNATLRDEGQRNIARLRTEEERVKVLEAQLSPLRNTELLLKAQIDSLKQEMTALSDANKRWKQRVEQLVEKYQQVDPAEYEKVCADKAALEKQLTEQQVREINLKAELATLKSSEGKTAEEEKGKTENLRKQYDRIKGFAKTWKTKAEALTKQVADKTKEADDKTALLTDLQKRLTQSLSEKAALEATKSDGAALTASANASWDKERKELKEKVDADAKRYHQMKELNTKLMTGMKALKQENSQLKGQVALGSTTQPGAATPAAQQGVARVTTTQPVGATPVSQPNAVKATTTPPVAANPASQQNVVIATPNVPTVPDVDMAPASKLVVARTAPAKTVSAATDATVPAKSLTVTPAVSVPVSAPVAPTLKTVSGKAPVLNPTAKPFVTAPPLPASAGKTVVATAPAATPSLAKPLAATPPGTVAPAKMPLQAEAKVSAPPAAPASGGAKPPLSEEDKLRLTLQQSMMKKFKKPADTGAKPGVTAATATATPTKPVVTNVTAAPAKPVVATATPTKPITTAATATPTKPVVATTGSPAGKPPIPAPTAAPPLLPTDTSKSIAQTSSSALPPMTVNPSFGSGSVFGAGSFGTGAVFGAGGASGLVFGKPGITLPVPASPTPTTLSNVPSAGTLFASAVSPDPSAQSADTGSATGGVGPTTEANRRSQRLARFAALETTEANAPSTTPKRPATADPDTVTPQKMAKLAQPSEANDGTADELEGTGTEEDDEQTVEESEETEDEGTATAESSPAPQAEEA